MKFFIDTGDLGEIKEAAAMGIIDGVTTNPSLLSKAGKPIKQAITEICEVVDGPVSAEVLATDTKGMLKEARELSQLHPNVVVKIPLIGEGLKAVKVLTAEGIKTNVTVCFSPNQGLLAAKAGATYISPFIGRLEDISEEGMEVVEKLVAIYNNYDFDTQVLVASIRSPIQVTRAALIGADVATIPFKVLTQLVHHPMTDIALARFLEDAKKIPAS